MFSITTTRSAGFRFKNGHFVMLGLPLGDRPLLRAYSIASANHEEHLEFLSIKVPDGQLTSKLQHVQPGDDVLVGTKSTGSLIVLDLTPGRNLYLLSTGTGLAPFMSIIRDPDTYERFERIVLVHGVRYVGELAYRRYITEELPSHEYLGEMVRRQLIYFPTVTREPFECQERLTTLLETGRLTSEIGLPPLDAHSDRAMICGGPPMLKDLRQLLDARGFRISAGVGQAGDYVIERAFVDT